jgi:hypothetical protein
VELVEDLRVGLSRVKMLQKAVLVDHRHSGWLVFAPGQVDSSEVHDGQHAVGPP